jgi:hypothetical protein
MAKLCKSNSEFGLFVVEVELQDAFVEDRFKT